MLPPVGGAMSPDSKFYIKRKADRLAENMLLGANQPIVIEGPFQVGKSSLLVRMIEQAKQQDKQVASLSLLDFDQTELESAAKFYQSFFRKISSKLSLADRTTDQDLWAPEDGNNANGNDYMAKYILRETTQPLLIAIDEANRLFSANFAADFFSMLRSWHEKRNEDAWARLNLILVIATSTDPFIKNHSVSPFNVAQHIYLQDFNVEQLRELNSKYNNPLEESSLSKLWELLSGHPYLTGQAFNWLITEQGNVEQLDEKAIKLHGPFEAHLNSFQQLLEKHPELKDSLKQLLGNNEQLEIKDNYALYRAGFVKYTRRGFKIRNELYRRFLKDFFSPLVKSKMKRIALLIHGIRSQGDWQERVVNKLEEGKVVKVFPIRYRYFNAFEFLSPILTRSRPISRVKKQLRIVKEKYPSGEISIIAQSFGAYIVGHLLKKNKDLKIRHLILFGSVLPREYEWEDVSGQVGEIVNECGKRDIWPVLAKATSWGYGASGTHGFGHVLVKDRFHNSGHGEYIEEEGFVENYWKPFIEQGTFVPSDYDRAKRKTPWYLSTLEGIPIQWIVTGLFIVALIIGGYFLFKPKGISQESFSPANNLELSCLERSKVI